MEALHVHFCSIVCFRMHSAALLACLMAQFANSERLHFICLSIDLKDRAASEVVLGHQPVGVERHWCGSFHQDHWLRPTGAHLPRSGKTKAAAACNTCILRLHCILWIQKNPQVAETNSWLAVPVYMIFHVGDWRTGTVAAQPPHRAGVYGPEAGTSHQALPPHWEGQVGVLPTVCNVAGVGGHGQSYSRFYVLILFNTLYLTQWWLCYTGHSCTTQRWIH